MDGCNGDISSYSEWRIIIKHGDLTLTDNKDMMGISPGISSRKAMGSCLIYSHFEWTLMLNALGFSSAEPIFLGT